MTPFTAHATIDQLADVVLGLAAPALAERAARHLETCPPCDRLAGALYQLRRVGSLDAAHRPTHQAVSTVRALAAFAPRRWRSQVRMMLSFDSLLCAAPAATRGSPGSSRHLVFYSQDYALDLRMDCERSGSDLVVVGQLLNRDTGPMAAVRASLVAGEEVLSRSTTGDLGEFHLDCRPESGLELHLEVGDEEMIEVRLDRGRDDPPPESRP